MAKKDKNSYRGIQLHELDVLVMLEGLDQVSNNIGVTPKALKGFIRANAYRFPLAVKKIKQGEVDVVAEVVAMKEELESLRIFKRDMEHRAESDKVVISDQSTIIKRYEDEVEAYRLIKQEAKYGYLDSYSEDDIEELKRMIVVYQEQFKALLQGKHLSNENFISKEVYNVEVDKLSIIIKRLLKEKEELELRLRLV